MRLRHPRWRASASRSARARSANASAAGIIAATLAPIPRTPTFAGAASPIFTAAESRATTHDTVAEARNRAGGSRPVEQIRDHALDSLRWRNRNHAVLLPGAGPQQMRGVQLSGGGGVCGTL